MGKIDTCDTFTVGFAEPAANVATCVGADATPCTVTVAVSDPTVGGDVNASVSDVAVTAATVAVPLESVTTLSAGVVLNPVPAITRLPNGETLAVLCVTVTASAAMTFATVTAALAPLLTLGIPTSATTAILLAAFQNYNLQPGPALLQTSGPLVWTLIASLYIGNVMLLVLNLPLIGIWVRVLRIPTPLLYGGILIFSTLGAYSLRQSWFDLLLLLIIGLVGLAMRRFGFPVAPVIVGMILGPMAEKQLRNALSIAQGDWSVFVTRPLSLAILCLIVAVLVLPRLLRRRVAAPAT